MQLILLSGGSGKRLWPLSNNTRSKQFLPLLETEDGTMESMVQRVVRQAIQAGLTTNITLATNASQLDIITNQLGDKVSVVTEPERRDTFPAVALAASYLSLEKQCADDEVVVIMPCDPYTESEYFHTIARMVQCVDANVADLILMGITPTYPSAKYGYVVLDSDSSFNIRHSSFAKPVARFTEKPTVEVAEQLLAEGAFWNGGVFAFRLGYMMNIVRKYVQYTTFAQTRDNYQNFPKISFDYEVAEKVESVAVVPFKGEWKDLGTWNTLANELSKHAIGSAVLGSKCENTHVINELQHPIFVDGVKDVVVAASFDGILVCGKEDTEKIKSYVEPFCTRPMYEERCWGTYRVLDDKMYADGNHSLTKSITIAAGKNISYQIHHYRTEVWTIVEGEGLFVLNGEYRCVKPGDVLIIDKENWHAIKALTQLTFIEVQMGNLLIEEDIERGVWSWY